VPLVPGERGKNLAARETPLKGKWGGRDSKGAADSQENRAVNLERPEDVEGSSATGAEKQGERKKAVVLALEDVCKVLRRGGSATLPDGVPDVRGGAGRGKEFLQHQGGDR